MTKHVTSRMLVGAAVDRQISSDHPNATVARSAGIHTESTIGGRGTSTRSVNGTEHGSATHGVVVVDAASGRSMVSNRPGAAVAHGARRQLALLLPANGTTDDTSSGTDCERNDTVRGRNARGANRESTTAPRASGRNLAGPRRGPLRIARSKNYAFPNIARSHLQRLEAA